MFQITASFFPKERGKISVGTWKNRQRKHDFVNFLYFFPANFDVNGISEKNDKWFNAVDRQKTNKVKQFPYFNVIIKVKASKGVKQGCEALIRTSLCNAKQCFWLSASAIAANGASPQESSPELTQFKEASAWLCCSFSRWHEGNTEHNEATTAA